MASYLRWLVEKLVANFIEPMKKSKSKQLAFCIFTCCIALAPSLPLLAGFVVQSILAVWLFQLARTDERSCKYSCAWHQLKILCKIWVWEVEGGDYWCFLTSSLVVYFAQLHSITHVPSKTTYTVRLLDCLE